MGFYKAGEQVGEGVGWKRRRPEAWRLRDGEPVEEISLEEARRVVEEHLACRCPRESSHIHSGQV